jgi:pyruvate kinase
VLVVQMMDRIVRAAESAGPFEPRRGRRREDRPQDEPSASAVTHAARVLAEDLGASAVVGVTRTGLTAHLLSRERAPAPIYAFSPDERVCRRLALWWGVTPVHHTLAPDLEGTISAMERHLLESGAAASGETVVVTGSHPFQVGFHTNFVKYHQLG